MFSGSPGTWLMPVAETATGFVGQDVVHDRQVVDGEIPDHADVVLEQARLTRTES